MTVIAPTATPMRKAMMRQEMTKKHWYLAPRDWKEASLILLKILILGEEENR